MSDPRGHQLAQYLSVITTNLEFVLGHPTRQGRDVDEALGDALAANREVSRMIRAGLIEEAEDLAKMRRPSPNPRPGT